MHYKNFLRKYLKNKTLYKNSNMNKCEIKHFESFNLVWFHGISAIVSFGSIV